MEPTGYLLVTGRGDPAAIDAYLYGDNGRAATMCADGRFRSVVVVFTSGGFGPGPQCERLRSGLYGAVAFDTAGPAFDGMWTGR